MNKKSRLIAKCMITLALAMVLSAMPLPFGAGNIAAFAFDTWLGDSSQVQTDIGNDTETYGYWYVATDEPEGGNSTVLWDYTVPNEGTPIIDSNIADYGGLSGTAVLDKGNSKSDANPYVMICFDVVGQTSDTDPTPAPGDASAWGGLSILYTCDCPPSLDLGLGESVDASIGYANPSASLAKSTGSGTSKILAWTDFKQPSWYKGATKISGTDAATQLVSVRFRIQAPAGTYHFQIGSIGPYNGGNVPATFSPASPPTYNIIYNLNGGENAADNPATFTAGTETFTLADPSRDGCAFAGWFSDLKLTNPASPTISQGTRCSKIFYAKWKRSLANSDITIETIPAQSYTGSAIEPAVEVKDGENDITDQCEFEYTDNTDAGTATVVITAKADNEQYGGRATATFQINKVDFPAGTMTAPTAKSLTYNGSAQELVNKGSVTDNKGTMHYALGENDTTAPESGWDAKIPTGTNTGTYYVWYKTVNHKNYHDSEPGCVKVTIGEKPSSETVTTPDNNPAPSGQTEKPGTDSGTNSGSDSQSDSGSEQKPGDETTPAKKGDIISDTQSNAKVKITNVSSVSGTAEYIGPCDLNTKSLTIPDQITKDGKTYIINTIAPNAFKGSKAVSATLGKNIKKISAKAFNGSKVKTITIKTKKLSKKSVKNALKGSKAKKVTIKVKIGKKKENQTYVNKYKKYFTAKNAGKKATIK